MKRRIFGLENEYGLTCTLNGQRRLSPDNVARYLFEKVIPGARNANVFLENGARLYLDTGLPPRVRHSRVRRHHRPGGPRQGGRAHRRGPAAPGREATPRGRHLRPHPALQEQHGLRGKLVRLPRELSGQSGRVVPALAEGLIPFFVTRQIFAGAGKVLQTPRGFHYCLSQRAQHICQEISGATTSSRSIINTRDEPHADAERVPAPARHRGRLQHVGGSDLAQGRHDRVDPGHDRGRLLRSGLQPAVAGPGDPGHQPRSHAARDSPAQGRAGHHAATAPDGVPRARDPLRAVHRRRPRHPGRACAVDIRDRAARGRSRCSSSARSTG